MILLKYMTFALNFFHFMTIENNQCTYSWKVEAFVGVGGRRGICTSASPIAAANHAKSPSLSPWTCHLVTSISQKNLTFSYQGWHYNKMKIKHILLRVEKSFTIQDTSKKIVIQVLPNLLKPRHPSPFLKVTLAQIAKFLGKF
jgi:hypothetical protein